MPRAASIRCAWSQSRCLTGLCRQAEKACLEKPSTRQVTATGTPPAARSRTSGQLIWGDLAGEERRRPAQDLVLLLQRLVPLPQLPQLRGLAAGHARPQAVVDAGELEPAVQAGPRYPEVPGDLRQRSLALAGHRDHVTAELDRERLRHDEHPSSEDRNPHRQGVNRARGSPAQSQFPFGTGFSSSLNAVPCPVEHRWCSPVLTAVLAVVGARVWKVDRAAVTAAGPYPADIP